MFLWGLAMSFLIPPWQCPDETSHLLYISMDVHNEPMFSVLFEDLDAVTDCSLEMREPVQERHDREALAPDGFNVAILKHIIPAMGIYLAIALGLNAFWVMVFGEIFSLLFYTLSCALALHLMPRKKELLFLTMLFPMAIQQAGSISYDATVNALGFLLVAYVFYLRETKPAVGWLDAMRVLVLLLWMSYCKPPYIVLGLLVFIIPKEKIRLSLGGRFAIDGKFLKKWKWILAAGLVVLCIAGMLVLKNSNWFVYVLYALFTHPKQMIYLFGMTVLTCAKGWAASAVGMFGWMESSMPGWFMLLTYVLYLILAMEKTPENGLSRKERVRHGIYLWIVFGVVTAALMASMVAWTVTVNLMDGDTSATWFDIDTLMYEIPYIGGVQGRYFLFLLPILGMGMPEWIRGLKGKEWIAPAYEVLAIVVSSVVLWHRYWV